MAIPDYQTLMLPVLAAVADHPRRAPELVSELSDLFGLSAQERAELLPSGQKTRIKDRVTWAATYLFKAGLLERPSRGVIVASPAGREVLSQRPARIDNGFLEQFAGFRAFKNRASQAGDPAPDAPDATPDEIMRRAADQINTALADDLLTRLCASEPAFFEAVIVDLLLRMGYGNGAETGQVLGRTGDDGVDGVINLDPLGVDQVYVQAKRYQPGSAVGAGDVRDFFGALAMKDVTKGIFVTTSHFTPASRETAGKLSKRIVLIDGAALARLMIRYSVGCRIVETHPVSVLEESYFE